MKIITGDNGLVAAKVCAQIGVECAGVLTGAEVEALDDDQLAAAIPATTVFARISPGPEIADHQGRPPRPARMSRSSATG